MQTSNLASGVDIAEPRSLGPVIAGDGSVLSRSAISRITSPTWDCYRICGEAALNTLGKLYEYNFVSDFLNEQYNMFLGPSANFNSRAMFIAKVDGKIVGVIGGALVGKVCQEVVWFVKPDYRVHRLGILLLVELEKWAREKKANFMSISRMKTGDKKNGYIPYKEILFKKLEYGS